MAKYSEKFKLMLVKEYQGGKLGYKLLAEKYGMKDSTPIKRWVKVYEKFGAEGLIYKETYSTQFKLDVLRYMERTGSSEMDTAILCAYFKTILPASVRSLVLLVRIINVIPNSSSNTRIDLLSAGCERCIVSAASVILLCFATSMNNCNCLNSKTYTSKILN